MSDIAQLAARAAQRLHVRSALNPMLWLTAIGTPICFFAAYAFRFNAPIFTALVIVGLVPIVVTVLGFAYFAIVDPGKLQSEDYQLRHEALQVMQGGQVIDATSLVAVTNPSQPALPPSQEGTVR